MTSPSSFNPPPLFKVVIVGQSGAGKTNILSRYITNNFCLGQNPTIGIQFSMKDINIGNQVIKMQIWDTAGQERYRSMNSIFYKNAVGALVVFDLSSRKTFEQTGKWIKQIREKAVEGIVLVLIGNKSDLPERQITTEEAFAVAKKEGMAYFQTSAAHNKNIEESFDKLSQQIYKKYKRDTEKKPQNQEPIKPVTISNDGKRRQKKPDEKCCNS